MIHNRYMEMSNIPGQDRGLVPHTQPLKCAPCPVGYHTSLCSSEAGGVGSGQCVQWSLILPGMLQGSLFSPIQIPEPKGL